MTVFKLPLAFCVTCVLTAITVMGTHSSSAHALLDDSPQFRQQKFRLRPVNTTATRGDTVLLRCEVTNQHGRLQWTKNGFALGYMRSLPGYRRYRMTGDTAAGVHNLQISSVRVEDEGRYQCQVSPNRGQKPIKADAFLSVLVPPSNPLIRVISGQWNGRTPISNPDYSDAQRVFVLARAVLTLECHVTSAVPAATITWFHRGSELVPDDLSVVASSSGNISGHDTRSLLRITPSASDDQSVVTCLVHHPTIPSSTVTSLTANITLTVMYPPSPPRIFFDAKDSGTSAVPVGQRVRLLCVAHGGNPRANLVWTKDNHLPLVASSGANTTVSWSSLTVTVDRSDFSVVRKCRAESPVQKAPSETSVEIEPQFGPDWVHVNGTREVSSVGQRISVFCVTASSNPASVITWMIEGQRAAQTSQVVHADEHGGWTTWSHLATEVPATHRHRLQLHVQCTASNTAVQHTRTRSISINILRPPRQPRIVASFQTPPQEGGNVVLQCHSLEGNPRASIRWLVGGRPIRARDIAQGRSQLNLTVSAAENGALVECLSENKVTSSVLRTTYNLTVLFTPQRLFISRQPEVVRAGNLVLLSCESSSSLPAAQLSWWKGQTLIKGINHTSDTSSGHQHGGYKSRLSLLYKTSRRDDGSQMVCRAEVAGFKTRVLNSTTLNVAYAPRFDSLTQRHRITLSHGAVINLTATANPRVDSYTLTRTDPPISTELDATPTTSVANFSNFRLTLSSLGVWKIDSVTKNLTGWYEIDAVNPLGKASTRIYVDVLFPPERVRVRTAVAAVGAKTILECSASGNPLPDGAVLWWRATKLPVTSGDGEISTNRNRTVVTSRLILVNVSQSQEGIYQCTFSNGIAPNLTLETHLLILRAPSIIKSLHGGKFALVNNSAVLSCVATGVPSVSIHWFRNGRLIDSGNSSRYGVHAKQINLTTVSSWLRVRAAAAGDLGQYECGATNRLGEELESVQLVRPSAPAPPYNLRVMNKTSHTATLMWTPGFDGGFRQSFKLMHTTAKESRGGISLGSLEVPSGQSHVTVSHLAPGTVYQMYVVAHNRLGIGAHASQHVTVRTAEASPPIGYITNREQNSHMGVGIGVGSGGGAVSDGGSSVLGFVLTDTMFSQPVMVVVLVTLALLLLLANFSLITCYIRRRRRLNQQGVSRGPTVNAHCSGSHCSSQQRKYRLHTPSPPPPPTGYCQLSQTNTSPSHWIQQALPSPVFEFRTNSFRTPQKTSISPCVRYQRSFVNLARSMGELCEDKTPCCRRQLKVQMNGSTPLLSVKPRSSGHQPCVDLDETDSLFDGLDHLVAASTDQSCRGYRTLPVRHTRRFQNQPSPPPLLPTMSDASESVANSGRPMELPTSLLLRRLSDSPPPPPPAFDVGST